MQIKPLYLFSIVMCLITILSIAILGKAFQSDEGKGFTGIANTPVQCIQQLHTSRQQTYSKKYIIPEQLKLLSWNIYKAQNKGLYKDLAKLNKQADIVLLQEAIEDPQLSTLKPYWRFAPGYKSGDVQSGVMTLSRWPATAHCAFTHKEPWLRSPKATNIVEYAITDQQRLLTVNMHGINFTLGTEDYEQQINAVVQVMQQHQGPIIFAGDLNAWSDARKDVVVNALSKLGLSEALYLNDKRTKAFGLALDQVWARGVTISVTRVPQYQSSDHNPIQITLHLNEVIDETPLP